MINVQLQNDADDKLQKVSGRCLILSSDHSIHKNNDVQLRNDADGKLQKVSGRCLILTSDQINVTSLALELPRKSVKHSSWKKLSYCFK